MRSALSAWPASSKAMTTTAAPYRRASRAWARKGASPSLRESELTIALPCTDRSPASITGHRDESIITGTRAIAGSPAMRSRKRAIAASESSIASSMFTSMTWAPFSTWSRAIATPAS